MNTDQPATDNRREITIGERTVYLIGTAHISQHSVAEVTAAITDLEPDRVCVELDQARFDTLVENRRWMELDIRRVLKQRKGFLLLTNIVLHSFQRRLGQDLGVAPGAEMVAAIDAARARDIEFVLCDRDVQVTLRRAWRRTSLWGRLKLLSALLAGALTSEELSADEVESLKSKGALQNMLDELAEYLPTVKEVLIDERDQYLAARILAAGGQRTVAVVGAGHVPGIERQLRLAASVATSEPGAGVDAATAAGGTPAVAQLPEQIAGLETVPPRSRVGRLLPWLVPALFAALVITGFLRAGPELTVTRLTQWVLVNGSFAALGALVALAHPLTIVSAFIAAPITSINPTIGVGIATGLVQAVVRKPRVADFEGLAEDLTSVRGLFRNRVTHVLVVFFLSSVGSAIGTFVGLSFLTSLLRGTP